MSPAEFGLLMGEEAGEGGQEPLLADDWVRQFFCDTNQADACF